MSNKQSSLRWLYEELNMFELGKSEFFSKNAIINHAERMHNKEMIEFSQEVFRNRYNQVHQSLVNIADDIYHEIFEGGNK